MTFWEGGSATIEATGGIQAMYPKLPHGQGFANNIGNIDKIIILK